MSPMTGNTVNSNSNHKHVKEEIIFFCPKWRHLESGTLYLVYRVFFLLIGSFHMTSRPPCWCPKQRKGGHVGAPTKSSGNLTVLLCKRFLLFSLKNMAVDHVSENQQFKICRRYWLTKIVFSLT